MVNEVLVIEMHEDHDTSGEAEEEISSEEERCDHVLVRGFRSLEGIYARCNVATHEPNTYYEALQSEAWRNAMEEELRMIEKNNTWIPVNKPIGKKII